MQDHARMKALVDLHCLPRHHLAKFFQHRRQLPQLETIRPDVVDLFGLAGIFLAEMYVLHPAVHHALLAEMQIAQQAEMEARTLFKQTKHQHERETHDRRACEELEPDMMV